MIFDSGLNDIDSNIFRSKYLLMIEDIAKSFPNKIGYYFKGKELEETKNIFQAFLDDPLSHHLFLLEMNYIL